MQFTTLFVVGVALLVQVPTTGVGGQNDARRQAVAYLREVNTSQMKHIHNGKRFATSGELVIRSPLPEGWAFTMVVDQNSYLALLTGTQGEAFTTSNKGLIYAGEVLR